MSIYVIDAGIIHDSMLSRGIRSLVKMFTSAIKSSPFPSFFQVGLPSRVGKVTMVTDGYPSKSPLNSPRDFHDPTLFLYPILKICFPRERLALTAVLEALV